MRLAATLAVVVLAAAPHGLGQVTPSSASLQVSQVTTGVSSSGITMAVDKDGNVYLLHDPGAPTAVGPFVSRVRPDGTLDLMHAVGLVDPGQLQYNPADGYVYVLDNVLGQMQLLVVLPGGGFTVALTTPMTAKGLAIDNNGSFYFGATVGPNGPGIYHYDYQTLTPTFLGTGWGTNGRLLALNSGDILIQHGLEIRRFTGGPATPLPFYTLAPQSGVNPSIRSMTRNTLNELGEGVILGEWSFNMTLWAFSARAVFLDPQAQNPATVGTETWSLPATGLQAVASGQRQDVYWYTIDDATAPMGTLWKIEQTPTPFVQGSYLATKTATVVTLSWYGPQSGGDLVLGGLLHVGIPNSPVFLPARGVLGLNPLTAGWFPIIDGIGLFGPPSPFGVTGPSGTLQLSAYIPVMGIPITLMGQGIILSADAPNGSFFITNVDTITLP